MDLKTATVAVSELSEGVMHVELDRPNARNAFNWELWCDLKQVFEALGADGNCRAIVLSARGKSFSAGLDVTDPRNLPGPMADVGRRAYMTFLHVKFLQECLSSLEACLKPTVCVIHGACVGAGIDLITATDVRLCSGDAVFSVREAAVGLAADVGSLARLPKIVGNDSMVRELALTARNFKSDEAKDMGLVSRVLANKEEAVEEAAKIAATIAAHSPIAVVGTKKNLNYARDHTVQESLDYVATWNAAMLQSEDVAKAMGAAMSKQKPTFSKL